MKNILSLLFLSLFFISGYSQNYWKNVTNDGFGNQSTGSTPALKAFKGKLFMSTKGALGNDSAYLYSSSNGKDFDTVFTGGQYRSISVLSSTNEGGGFMYAGENDFGSSKVYRTPSGNPGSFVTYFNAAGPIVDIVSFKGLNAFDSIFVIYNGSTFGFISKSSYDSNDPANDWIPALNISDNFSDGIVHNNEMFISVKNNLKLYKTTDGINFTIAFPTAPFGSTGPNNTGFSTLGSKLGPPTTLFAGTENMVDGAELWKSSDNGATWQMAGKYPGFSKITSIKEYNGDLWVTLQGLPASQKLMILKSSDGINFNISAHGNFGNSDYRGLNGSTELFDNKIFYSFSSNNSGDILYQTCLSPSTINLGPDQIICKGNVVTFDAGIGSDYIYEWNTGNTSHSIVADTSNFYWCVKTDIVNNCSHIDTVKLTVNPLPLVTTSIPFNPNRDTVICKGSQVTLVNAVNTGIRNPYSQNVTNTVAVGPFADISDNINIPAGTFFEPANITLEWVKIDSLTTSNNWDMKISLIAPDSSEIILINATFTSDSDFIGTELNKNSLSQIPMAGAPYTGKYKPYQPFSNLTGFTDGTWQLRIQNLGPTSGTLLKGWSMGFSSADTVVTYSWSPAINISPTSGIFPHSMPLNTIVTGDTTTQYILTTTTTSSGCVSKDTFDITVPSMNIIEDDTILCSAGTVSYSLANGFASTNWYSTTNSILPVASTQSVSFTVNTNGWYYAKDSILGCIVYSDTVKVTINPSININSITASPDTICMDDLAKLTAIVIGGSPFTNTPSYIYKWITSVPDTVFGDTVFVYPTTSTTYTLHIIDSLGCVNTDSSVQVVVRPFKDIKGNIIYNAGANSVGSGIVIAYDTLTKDSVSFDMIGGAGDYSIPNIPPGDYLILCYADTTNANYKDLIPTYYGDEFLWDTATIVNHGCISNSTPIDINMQALVPNGTGQKTSISGRVSQKAGYRIPGDPIPGRDVKIGRVPPNGIIFTDTTESDGVFRFDSVEVGSQYTYTLYIDMPAYTKDASYSFVLTPGNMNHPRFDSLNYIVDSNTIWIDSSSWLGMSINDLTFNKINSISISPNPSSTNTIINYSITNKSKTSLGLYNTMGIKIEDFFTKEMNEGKYSYQFNHFNKYPPGIYYIVLMADGKKSIAKLIIVK